MEQAKKQVPHLKAWGDWLVKFQKLDDAEFGRFIRGAIGYVCAGEVPTFDGIKEEMAFDYVMPSLDKERENYLAKCEKNIENGKKGADARWGKDGERHAEDSDRHLTDGENSQEEEKEEDKRKKREEKRDKKEDTSFFRNVADEEAAVKERLQNAWRNYNKVREEMGKPITGEDMAALQANLKKYAGDDKRKQAELLEKAADKGWMNVFPDEEEKSKAHQVNGTVKKLARGMAL